MKKNLAILGVAVLALASCAKTQVISDETPSPIAFKAVVSNAVKADAQLEGTSLTADYAMYISATQYKANGSIETAAYFKDVEFTTADATPGAASEYKAAAPLYWPIGNAALDFVAYAMPSAKHGTPAATYDNEATNVASKVSFMGWDTYANQVDLLYDVKNGATTATNALVPNGLTVNFTLKHAQALLVFQTKVNTTNKITINSITIPELKVNGDFVIDNTKNVLNAHWENLNAVPNEDVVAPGTDPNADNLGDLIAATDYAQIGSSLLIPEQPRINFVINYTISGNTMNYTVNLDRGNWEMGKKYIYQLDITLNEIIATQVVEDFLANTTTSTSTLN